jgi:DNA anti-recombination protein RmuC
MFNKTILAFVALAFLLLNCSVSSAQEKQDPTAPSDIIKETLSKIRDVEKLDTFIQQNNALKTENQKLKKDVAKIQQQLAKLTKDLESQSANLRKQLLQMPTFQVQSKILGNGRSMALLKSKESVIRIRTNTEMSVPVAEGVWVLMQVKKISKDMIELYFPELERTVYLYD